MGAIDHLSSTERETLKAIHRFTVERRRGGAADAKTGDLSGEIGLTPGTITATLKRLAEAGYVNHHPYRGVTLTGEGMLAAIATIRRHRIVERFLSDYLGYEWNEADRLAPKFEHQLPAEVEARMYDVLGKPDSCPHGFPIPEPQAELPALLTLIDLEKGDTATVAVPGSIDAAVATYLDELGIKPGVEVIVLDNKPLDGLVVISIDGKESTVGERVAREVFVVPEEQERKQSA